MTTLNELRKGIAKELGIKGRWKMNKPQPEDIIVKIVRGKEFVNIIYQDIIAKIVRGKEFVNTIK